MSDFAKFALGVLVLLALMVARVPMIIVLVAVVLFGLAMIWFWGFGGRGPSWLRPARGPQTVAGRSFVPLQTTLFRSVLVTLVVLLAVVGLVVWWRERPPSQDRPLPSTDLATAQLDLAYETQPALDRKDKNATDVMGDSTGLWFDVAAYKQIKQVIEKLGNSGISDREQVLLDGQDSLPLSDILPTSMVAKLKTQRAEGLPDIMNPSYGLPLDSQRPMLTYVKEHGWRVGWLTTFNHRKEEFAIWRTGANTAFFVLGGSGSQGDPWYSWAVIFAGWGMLLYAFLAPFAAVAAWYANRRIVRPVAEVAAASVALADGEHPDPLPVKGPYELAAMAHSFNRMSKKLKQAEAAEEQFLMSVSHELKTPLTAIEGYAELMADGSVPAEEAAKVLTAESGRLRRLVADLIDLGKMRQSSFAVRKEPVDLHRVAEAVAQRYQTQAKEFGVTLTQTSEADAADEAAALVIGDEDRLVQAVSNLVENALRCTPKDGTVTIEIWPDGTLAVRDTGPGLPADDLARAFERFYLYERSKEDRSVGTGLGLAIVKELVDAMGGEVNVASEPQNGTTFTVRLPQGCET